MYVWIGIFIVLLVIELLTTDLVTIWFIVGALASFITSIFTDNLAIQIGVFLVVSVISLIIARPLIKKYRPKLISTNYDRVLNKEGIITKEVSKDSYGQVKVLGQIWTCKSDRKIEVGTKVEILSIDGVKLIVKEKEKN